MSVEVKAATSLHPEACVSPELEAGVYPELESVPLEHLEREIGELAAHIHAATCRWLLLVAEFDRREGWLAWGAKSCGQWLSWRCGIAPRAAREQVRVARRLAELPLVREAFERGQLSYSKVRALSRVASEKSEAELVPLALELTAAQLERLVRRYRGVVTTQIEQTNQVFAERYVDWEWDDDGSLLLRGRLPAEDGALLLKALEAARNQLRDVDVAGSSCAEPYDNASLRREDGSAEPSANVDRGRPPGDGDLAEPSIAGSNALDKRGSAEPPLLPARRSDHLGEPPPEPQQRPTATNADALVALAETLLCSGPVQRTAGERYQLVVHVEERTLAESKPDGCCELEDGPALPAETVRRLGCDSSLVAIVERDGRPLSVGRKRRTVPPALRRALGSRDHGCRFPGCNERRFVDAHHIQHWAQGGETKLSNLLLLCRHHHRLIHEGGYGLERRPGGGVRFRRPDGRPIPAVPRNRPGNRARLVLENRAAGLEVTQETPAARSACERVDYDIAIEGMLAAEGLLSLGWVTPWHHRAPEADEVGTEPGGSAEPELSKSRLLS